MSFSFGEVVSIVSGVIMMFLRLCIVLHESYYDPATLFWTMAGP